MSFKSIFYNVSHLSLFVYGLALLGISIFLLSNAVTQFSQIFFLTSCYLIISSLFGLLAHRFEKCSWYKYNSWNLILLSLLNIAFVLALGFFNEDIKETIALLEGGDSYEVTKGVEFIQNSTIAWLVFGTVFAILMLICAAFSNGFHKATYKTWVNDEWKRLNGLSNEMDNQPSGSGKKGKKGKKQAYEEDEPLIINVN